MTRSDPITELDPRYSAPDAAPVTWPEAQHVFAEPGVSWLSTVRPDGRPHVTPVLTVLVDGTVHFCTGPDERKRLNMQENPRVVLTTGTSALDDGIDVVIEGTARRITDEAALHRLADAWVAKYGEDWRFHVRDGAFHHASGVGHAWVFAVRATTGFGFGKAPYSQTRWTFNR